MLRFGISTSLVGIVAGCWTACMPVRKASTLKDSSVNPNVTPPNEGDVPTAGRSLFDHLLADPTGTAGAPPTIPFPFTELTKKLESAARRYERQPEGGESLMIGSLVPFGRSLQKFASDPLFYKFPRTIFAYLGDVTEGTSPLGGTLFLGYNEVAEAMEIISYNFTAGRFEFQVVRNYAAGKTPKVLYASRDVCLSCHQNRGPIFPAFPWSETDNDKLVGRAIGKARGLDPNDSQALYNGTLVFYSNASAFNDIVAISSKRSLLQAIWQRCNATGDKIIPCHGFVLNAALSFALPSPNAAADEYKNLTGIAIDSNGGSEEDPALFQSLGVKFSELKDRNPFKGDLTQDIRPDGPDELADDINGSRQLMQNLSPDLDPASKDVLQYQTALIAEAPLAMFRSLLNREAKAAGDATSALTSEAIADLVKRAQAGETKVLSINGFHPCLLYAQLKKSGDQGAKHCIENNTLPVVVDAPDGSLDRFSLKDDKLRRVFVYCDRCHRNPDEDDGVPNFLYGKTEDEIWKKVVALKPRIQKRLQAASSPMPPKASIQYQLIQSDPAAKAGLLDAIPN